MSQPLLTVAVTAYNYAHYLPVCLDSILGQDFTDFELYILDNCSTDNTIEVVERYLQDPRVHYVRHEQNIGSLANFNYACKVGHGRYFALISADDFILPGHFRRLMESLLQHPECALAYGKMCQVDSENRMIGVPGHGGNTPYSYIGGRDEVTDLLVHGVYNCLPAIIFDRSMTGDLLTFDLDTWGASDWDLIVRIAQRHPNFIYHNEVSTCYRRHAGQYTSTNFYLSPEPLYGHMFMLEQALATMPAQQIADHGARFAALLRNWSMQFGLSELDEFQRNRLEHILKQLEEGGTQPRMPGQVWQADRISVIIALPQLSPVLGKLLDGLRRQTHSNWECVIVHSKNCRLDQQLLPHLLPEDAERRLMVLPHDGDNLADLLNAGIARSSGEIILPLSQAPELTRTTLSSVAQAFAAQTGADIVSLDPVARHPYPCEVSCRELGLSNPVPLAAAIRRKIATIAGRFNPSVGKTAIMYDFWVRALKRGARIMCITDVDEDHDDVLAAPPLDPIDRARLIFANPVIGSATELREAMLLLLREAHRWVHENNAILERNPADSTAYSLRAAAPDPARKTSTHGRRAALGSQAYTRWLLDQRPTDRQISALRELTASSSAPRVAAIVLAERVEADRLGRTLRSLLGQIQPASRIIVLGSNPHPDLPYPSIHWLSPAGTPQDMCNELLRQLDEEWIYLVHGGDALEPSACAMVVCAVLAQPELAFIYSDEDVMNADGSLRDHAFKPSMNLDLLRSTPYIGRNIAVRRDTALQLGGFSAKAGGASGVDLLLRVVENLNFSAVGHIDRVLSHQAVPLAQWQATVDVSKGMALAVHEHLQRLNVRAQILPIGEGMQRVAYRHDDLPGISLIIRSSGALAALQACLTSILEKTLHTRFEVIVAPPRGVYAEQQETRTWVRQLAARDSRVRVVEYESDDGTTLNLAVVASLGEYLVFLEDSTRVVQEQWLEIMQGYAQRPEVGVVGPLLADHQGKIVSAGIVLGLDGAAGDVFSGQAWEESSYMSRLRADQNYSAVRGDCIMVDRRVFQSLGGFQTSYAGPTRAIDLCLRIKEAGYLCVWTPHTMMLIESDPLQQAALLRQEHDDKVQLMRMWWHWLGRDPAFNRNLSLDAPEMAIEIRHGMNSPISLGSRQLTLAVWHFSPSTAALQDALEMLTDDSSTRIVQLYSAPTATDLAKLAPDTLLLTGIPDESALVTLQHLRALTSVHMAYYVSEEPPAQRQAAFRQACALADRVVLADAALSSQCPSPPEATELIPPALPVSPWNNIARMPHCRQRLRVGLPGDLVSDQWSTLAEALAPLAGQFELVVYARHYPLVLQGLVSEYHQLSPFQANPAHQLQNLDLDLALIPAGASGNRHIEMLRLGACATALIVVQQTDALSLPVRKTDGSVQGWRQQLQCCIAEMDRVKEEGMQLRQAVLLSGLLDTHAQARWRKSLGLQPQQI